MHKNNIFSKNIQSDAKKKMMEKQLFPEKNSTELHSGNIVMMK
ncbi:hypothetical protein SAMN05216518_1329 [Bacteroidales bacterium KHT7]|nr:hypothetical protein SAMN05216518_1329 [Bacteroidales bacterium KHT7]